MGLGEARSHERAPPDPGVTRTNVFADLGGRFVVVLGRLSSTSIPAIDWRADIGFTLHGDQAVGVTNTKFQRSGVAGFETE